MFSIFGGFHSFFFRGIHPEIVVFFIFSQEQNVMEIDALY